MPRLLRAVALTRSHHPDVQLWIVGDGPLELSLRKLTYELGLNDSVTFFGEQADVSPFMLAADLFVSSSVTEGLPVSLLEAMSVGLPAVVTDVGGMGEIARLSGAVTLVPSSDPQAHGGRIVPTRLPEGKNSQKWGSWPATVTSNIFDRNVCLMTT